MKFGSKKKDAKPKAEGKKEKSKRKRRSDNNSMAGLKTWLTYNIEKILLAVIAGVSLWIIYSGLSKEGLPTTKSPTALQSQIDTARASIDRTQWDTVRATRYPEPDRFDEQATNDSEDVDLSQYDMSRPFHPVLKKPEKLRTDPVLLVATDLEVKSGYGALQLKSESGQGREGGGGFGRRSRIDPKEGERNIPENLRQKYSRTGEGEIESVYFTTILGLVPLREQLEAYNDAFIGAAEFDDSRDTPLYGGIRLERREIANAQPGDWQAIDSFNLLRTEKERWSEEANDEVANQYIHPNLTMSIPPIVGKEKFMESISIHSKVETEEQAQARESLENQQEVASEGRLSDDPFANLNGEGGNMRRPNLDDEDFSNELSLSEERLKQLDSDKILIRFFDLTVSPGKKYQYRVRLVLEDPNNPLSARRPTQNACEPSVIVRRQKDINSFIRETDWSEPSPIVSVPNGSTVLASKTEGVVIRGGTASYLPSNEPKATVLAVAWDGKNSREIPVEMNVSRGMLLNAKKDIEAIDVKRSLVVSLKDYPFKTNSMVLDIAGGTKLDSRGLRSPGTVLIMTSDGHLQFRSEFGDQEEFDGSIIPPAEETDGFNRMDEGNGEVDDGGRNNRRNNRRRGGRNRRGRGGEGERGGFNEEEQ